ncbi:hypothetical protein NBH00_06050 [Paraconexibacter antarcticus]|uniref:Uncharacterized protein n=1 Tax=Paraconexibacter antarcticus TaxID=2949664 RepID=A0ABY5DXX5_9ACTN|nr:hypothetical protein [Paraconexibacter antarcticus]UTI65774.1 hypothetical protein NBH00_06050 [Paraconexibacter antarcticus]
MAGGPSGGAGRAAAAAGFARRVVRAFGALEREQRTVVIGALALFVTMFLPWYSQTVFGQAKPGETPPSKDVTLTAFGAFSFVEAAVLLVALGLIWLFFARAEGKAFHLPFGDGNVVFAAGVWVCLLVFWRFFDKPAAAHGATATAVGITWGIFVTAAVGVFIALSGQRLRAAHLVEPPLPGDVAPSDDPLPPGRRRPSAARERAWEAAGLDVPGADAPTRVDGAGRTRPRPEPDARPTVVDRRGPSTDETLLDVPEFGTRRTERTPEPPADPDGQLRLDGG